MVRIRDLTEWVWITAIQKNKWTEEKQAYELLDNIQPFESVTLFSPSFNFYLERCLALNGCKTGLLAQLFTLQKTRKGDKNNYICWSK
jgi:hypothetical protein